MVTVTTREIKCPHCGAEPHKPCRSVNNKPLSDNHAARHLLSLGEAAKLGIERLRKPIWANPMDHIKIHIVEKNIGGLWVKLYSPANKVINGRDPIDLMIGGTVIPIESLDYPAFEKYDGPLPDSPEYKADEAMRIKADVTLCS